MKWGKLLAFVVGGLSLIILMTLRSPSGRFVSGPVTHPGANPVPRAANPPAASPVSVVSTSSSPSPSTAIASVATNQPASDIASFDDWARRRLGNDPAADAIHGEALAWKRRQAMLELIETDPELALKLAAPFSWRTSLPENVTRHFEQWIDARGDFEMALAESASGHHDIAYRWAIVDGQRYKAFVHGRRLMQTSRRQIPLHGIAIEDKIALTPDSIRLLDTDEAGALSEERKDAADDSCAVCGRKTHSKSLTGDIGGELRRFCGKEHVELANESLLLPAFVGPPTSSDVMAGGSDAWAQGRKQVLYIRLNFPDDLTQPNSEAAAYATMDSVNEFYVENSYNQTWLSTTVTPLLTLPRVKAWYATAGPGALLDDARAVARKAGFDTANYDRDIISHTEVPGYDWAGLGVVNGKGTWLQSYGVRVTAHELGHNAGLLHANFWATDERYSAVYGGGTNVEYGNGFDTMGSGTSHFGAMFKHQLGWLPPTAVHPVVTGGVYRVYPFDASFRENGRFYAARVRKDSERDYWLEFRRLFPGNNSLVNGLLLNWSSWSQGRGAGMLDAHPATISSADSPVVIGRTFSDRQAGVHITPVARGATGAEPWIDVRVHLDDSARNIPCCLKVQVQPTNAAPGQLVRFHATVADRDDDSFAYSWSFDDGTISLDNSLWAYKSWQQPGEHVVRCEVSDMRGGRASANVVVTVGAPSGYRVSGVVIDENGSPVEDVLLTGAVAAPGAPVTGLTDSDGAFVLTGVDGLLDFSLSKYGYRFEPVDWYNPLYVTSNTFNVLFIARPLTNVSLSLTTNLLVENSGVGGQMTLKRTGTVSNEMTAVLFVSGTATILSDIAFTPPLSAGTNLVVIPAGADRVVFNFTPVNNATVEPTETLYVSVRETEEYVVTSLAEHAITILDDDQPAVPAVSVVALDGPVLENGMNLSGFVFTRTGGTGADLPVTFSSGGTATPGKDYATLLGTVIIPAGSSSAIVQLRILDDKEVEPNETVIVTISPSPMYSISGGAATATILDDDVLVVTVSPTLTGLSEAGGTGRFTIKRDGDVTSGLVVHYTMTGSASNGVDYVSPPGTVTIPPGVTSADVAISPLDDLLVEGDETVTLVLATNAAYNIGTPSAATLTLRDNELVTVTVTAPDDEASEPGSDFGQFTITRTGVAGSDLVVPLAINGTATPGADFVPLPNPVIIPAGSSSVDLIVIPFEDLFHEVSNETVIVTLLSSPDYNIGSPGQATVTILDNDQFGTPAVGFASAQFAAPENESPGLTVVLSHTSSIPITVQYQVIGGTASSADYTLPPGTLSFEPGEWGKSIPLPIVNDTLAEADETIRVTLFNPTSAAHDAIQIMTYTILDDDVSSVSVAATSPNASETGPVPGNFRVTRVGGTNLALTVNFQITGTASAPGDCPDLGTSVVIPAGENFVDLPVMPVDDGTVELDEFLKLTLISAPGGKIVAPSTAIITILDANTNGLPTVWVSATNQPYAVEGGDSGTFVFSRTGDTAQSLTVYLNTAGSAVSGGDYTPLPASVVIPVGQNSVNIPVNPVDDPAVEGDETVVASLIVHDTYRVLYPGTATVTIQDNDQSVRIDAADFDASEPGNDVGEFIFTRFGTTNAPLQVFFDITGSAANGVDYAGIPGSVTIPAGSLTTGLIITPLDDALVEGLETVTLTLQASAAYTVGSPTAATVTIRDDEPVVGLVSNMDRLSEGARVPATITVRREGDPAKEFTARLAVGGSATFGVDYPAFETNVVFNCGVVAVDLWISPTNELAFEDEEELTVTLLPDTAYSLMPDIAATVAIEDVGTNLAPVVTITSPTTNVVYVLPSTVNLILAANIEDPNGDWLSPVWSQISGPDALAFGDVNQTNTTVTLTNSGVYVLRLSANDGYVTGYEDLTVVVGALERLTNSSAGEELLRWSFDEGLGATVFDESGNNRHGSIQGATGWITNGIAGGALNLSGANNFVRVENDSSFMEGLTRFTIACWIGPQSVPDTRGLLATDDGGAETTLTLASRAGASCGSATNVIEATMATICDSSRLVSAPNALTNGWQHILLTWSNGLAPQLYINGQFDQPNRHKTPLRGELVNCPQFLLGKGPSDIPATWAGKVDELRVFSWHMSAAEVGAFVAANFAAVIEMPTNIVVPVVTPVQLSGVVTDDNRPVPPGGVTFTWSQVSGPMDVEIPDPAALTNEISFTQSGEYTFRLIADDGQVKVYADLPVTVVEPTQVHAYASDSFAAELGPDTAEFTFTRNGDLSFELTVFFTLGGTASNGVDYVEIPNTGSITFPVEVDFLTIPVTPFLDHRTEGNETIVITVVSNVLYTIVSAEAVVTIQDSPYGMWNIGHFTLEELTDPSLSGETADFDGDGFFNFVEYAANRLPKSIETNALLQTSIELDENTGLRHITLTYQRRIEPTDVAYAAAVSTNLLDWQTGSNAIEEISATADPNGLTETVKARVLSPWPSNVPQFVTVRVWLRSTGP